jgi:hypothetical protein
MFKKIIVLSAAAALVSCGGNEKAGEGEVKKDTTAQEVVTHPENELAEFKFTTLVINVPSPFEIIGDLSKSKIPFNAALPNPVANESKYSTSARKGLNYGVYVVDLVYLSTHEQYADVKPYFKTARNLAVALDCEKSFDNIASARLEQNIDKKDTINKIMDKLYGEMDAYLRSNDRVLTATQILVGSWVESQYITLSVIKDAEKNADTEILFTKVWQQKATLDKLVELLAEFEKEKEMKPVIDGMKELQALYTNEVKGEAVDKAVLGKIHAKLSALRGKIVG